MRALRKAQRRIRFVDYSILASSQLAIRSSDDPHNRWSKGFFSKCRTKKTTCREKFALSAIGSSAGEKNGQRFGTK